MNCLLFIFDMESKAKSAQQQQRSPNVRNRGRGGNSRSNKPRRLEITDQIDVRGDSAALLSRGVPVGRLYELEIIEGEHTPVWYLNHDSPDVVARLEFARGSGELALDLEWRFDFSGVNNPIALMQFCGSNGAVIVKMCGPTASPALTEFVQRNRFIMKGASCDIRKMENMFGVKAEIEDLEVSRLAPHGITPNFMNAFSTLSMKKTTAEFKNKKISMSNWAAPYLNHMQFLYACFDAIATYRIYRCLLEKYPEDGAFIKFVPKVKAEKSKARRNLENENKLRSYFNDTIQKMFQDKPKCSKCEFCKMDLIVDHIWDEHPEMILEIILNMSHSKIQQKLAQIASFLNCCSCKNGKFVLNEPNNVQSSSFIVAFNTSDFNVDQDIKTILLKYLLHKEIVTINDGESESSAASRIWKECGVKCVELLHGELPILESTVEDALQELNVPSSWIIAPDVNIPACTICPKRFFTKGQAIIHFIRHHCKTEFILSKDNLTNQEYHNIIVQKEKEKEIIKVIGIKKKNEDDILVIQVPKELIK